jgi:hypothetical protein
VLAVLALVVGSAIAAWFMSFGFRQWFAGYDIFELLAPAVAVAAALGWLPFGIIDRMLGLAYALGLLCGCTFVNLWAVRKARRLRRGLPTHPGCPMSRR